MEKLACLLSSPSGLVVALGYGRLEFAPYAKGMAYERYCSGHGGAMGVVIAHQLPCPVWLACCRRGLRPCAPLLWGEVAISLYGRNGCPIAGYLLPGESPNLVLDN